MYCGFFGLRRNPFEDRAGAQFFYATPQGNEILAAVENETRCGEGMVLVLGEAGVGKTLLIRALLLQTHSTDHAVVLTRPADGEMDLIREACKRFGATLPSSCSHPRGLAALRRHLRHTAKAGHHSILIIDQAENLTTRNLSELAMLTDLQQKGDGLLTIVLVGRPRFPSLLEKPESARIRRRLLAARTLPALTLDETVAYIQHRLRIAGAGDPNVFDHEAVAMIHQASKGIPRLINQMCDTAMAVAYGVGKTRIDREIAAEVTEESASVERSVDAREIGVGSAREVARGLLRSPPTRGIIESQQSLSGSSARAAPAEPHGANAGFGDTSEAVLLQSTAVEKRLASLTESAQSMVSGLSGSIQNTTESLSAVEERMWRILNEAEHRMKLLETRMSRVLETTNEAGEQADEASAARERSQVALVEKVNHEAARLEERVNALESRQTDVQLSVAALGERVESAAGSVGELQQTIGHVQSAVEELGGRADAAKTGIAESVKQGRKLMLDAREPCGQTEALQRSVATSLLEIGSACEHTNALREQVTQCEQVTARLTSAQDQGKSAAKKLDAAVSSASRICDMIESAAAEVESKISRLDSHNAAAMHVLHDLSEANVTGHRLIERANESMQPAREVTEQLAQRIEQARQVAVDTEGKIGQLDARGAAAKDVLDELSEASGAGRGLLEKATESARTAEQVARTVTENIDRLLEDISGMTAKAEVTAEKLAGSYARAESLIESVEDSAQPARHVAERLAQHVEGGKQLADSMAEQCGQAGKLLARLASTPPLLRDMKDVEGSVKATLNDARAVYDDLTDRAHSAEQRATMLRDVNAAAENLIERHTQLEQESQQLAEQLTEQLAEQAASTQSSAEAGRYLVAEFAEQAHGLAGKLHELRVKVTQIEQSIAQATNKPAELIAGARAQTAQLEQVCAAVRKVFAGLSKASLDATQQTDRFNRASREADERLARLSTDTERASSTLHEWIEEAVRVQTMLERTLQQAPSIRETHPSGGLLRMSRTLQSANRITNPSASGELQMLSEPETEDAGHDEENEPRAPALYAKRQGSARAVTAGQVRESPLAPQPVTKPKTRAEEVSQLIEDAKRTAGGES